MTTQGEGTKENPWRLKTPSGESDYEMYIDDTADPPLLVCEVGSTTRDYLWRGVADLHAMLLAHGDWMLLGSADEKKEAAPDTVEAWARSADNPVRGWYGTKKGLRGRFANYVPPLLEALGQAEVEHGSHDNRMRALPKTPLTGISRNMDQPAKDNPRQ